MCKGVGRSVSVTREILILNKSFPEWSMHQVVERVRHSSRYWHQASVHHATADSMYIALMVMNFFRVPNCDYGTSSTLPARLCNRGASKGLDNVCSKSLNNSSQEW